MIENTLIEKIINRCFDSFDVILGIPRRARKKDGTYKADNLSTPDVNEAWKSGAKKVSLVGTKKKKRVNK
tara:strand:+ start:76 stop:285 length:210 start_codon:yes stop_codon:yes gene_type:complete